MSSDIESVLENVEIEFVLREIDLEYGELVIEVEGPLSSDVRLPIETALGWKNKRFDRSLPQRGDQG